MLLVKLYTNRLANLVQLFNAESHAVETKPVHEIYNAIAKFVFDKCVEKNVGSSTWKLKHWCSHKVEVCNFGKLKSLFFPVSCCIGAALKEKK